MTIPSTTDDLIAELERFAEGCEYICDAHMANSAAARIRELEKDAARFVFQYTNPVKIMDIELESIRSKKQYDIDWYRQAIDAAMQALS